MKIQSAYLPFEVAVRLLNQNDGVRTMMPLLENLSEQSIQDLAPLLVVAARLPSERSAAWTVGKLLEVRPEWANARADDGHAGRQETALDVAINMGRLALVDTLLELGADAKRGTGRKKDTVLRVAARATGNARVMDAITTAILEKGKYTADQKAIALAEAANDDNLGAVRALLRAGADFSMRISSVGDGGTIGSALAAASFHNEDDGSSEKIVAEMLASPKSRGVLNDGWENESFGAPVHCAAFNGNTGILRQLIGAGATVNPPEDLENYDIATPLMSAASGIQPDAIKVLIEAGANARLVDANGRNAIHHLAGSDSAMEEDEELPYLKLALEELAKAGCESRAMDGEGQAPADIARECGREQFADLLESYTVEVKPIKVTKKKMKA